MKAHQAKATVIPIDRLLHCVVCNKPMQAPYGRHRDCDGTCNRVCETIYEKEKQHENDSRLTPHRLP